VTAPGQPAEEQPDGQDLVASGPGSIVIGRDNYGTASTSYTHNQYVRLYTLFSRRQRPTITDMADRLAKVVRGQWAPEAARLGVHDDHRLPVSWGPLDPGLCCRAEDAASLMTSELDRSVVERSRLHWATSDGELAGSGAELTDVWLRKAPARRLVLLGDAGSGKTELMIRTLTALINRREEFGLVPVLVPVSSWELEFDKPMDWLEVWLIRNYRFLAAIAPGENGATYARARGCQMLCVQDPR
jgi:hypothetical protein